MTVIKQLNEHKGVIKAIVEVNGVMVAVELNEGFKSHLERNQEVIKKAEEIFECVMRKLLRRFEDS